MKRPLPDHIEQALHTIIDYLYEEEREHFDGCSPAERQGHIFESLETLRTWLLDE
jgi:hypothetical protein